MPSKIYYLPKIKFKQKTYLIFFGVFHLIEFLIIKSLYYKYKMLKICKPRDT